MISIVNSSTAETEFDLLAISKEERVLLERFIDTLCG